MAEHSAAQFGVGVSLKLFGGKVEGVYAVHCGYEKLAVGLFYLAYGIV